jgi:hypothetical protein
MSANLCMCVLRGQTVALLPGRTRLQRARLRRLGRPAAPPCSFPPQQAAPPCLVLRKVIAAWRNRLDTTFSDITVEMGLARHGAHTFWDLLARTAASTARTLLRVCLSYE